ncbi:M50 family metallopeptidase [Ancylobacter sp. 3268]|uniref:M50 family metallopeptidase n=1 Tax=Ancylobacter sp. 3268 TaxID=2817752 RepID=UPI00286CDAA8|nr:hypothetical protein [Ancylobacter sp. 3268]
MAPAEAVIFDGPILATAAAPIERDRRVAVHEASHAVVAVAVGGRVVSVTIDGQPRATHAGGLPRLDGVVITMAGPLGEGVLHHRSVYRPPDTEVAIWSDAARRCAVSGQCDDCRIAIFLAASTPDGGAFVATYRRAEDRTLALLDQPHIRSAIREVAAELLTHGTLTGDAVHQIAARHGVA